VGGAGAVERCGCADRADRVAGQIDARPNAATTVSVSNNHDLPLNPYEKTHTANGDVLNFL
jgi:hypothetical protein